MVTFPQFSELLIEEIIKIATFDLMQTITFEKVSEGDILGAIFSFPDESADQASG